MDAWDSILGKDEKIIWQGRPSAKFQFRPCRRNEEPDGFELVSDAPEVMRLIRDIQDPANHLEAP